MDSIGDYIYLIIIAIAGLSSLFKKKKNQTIPTFDEEDDDSPIFGDYKTEVIEPEIKAVEPIKNQEKSAQTTYISYENTSSFSDLKAKKQVSRTIKETPKAENKIFTIEENQDYDFIQLDTRNDARKAFIYSEIFNKKY